MFLLICVATTPRSHAEEQSLIEAGVVGTQKVLNLAFYKICVNIIIIMAKRPSLLDGTSYLPRVEEKLVAILVYLGSSSDQSNLIMKDCPSTQ